MSTMPATSPQIATAVGFIGLTLALFPASAYAAGCTVLPESTANLQWLSCQSDTQANDGDDLKMFVDGVSNATSANGSLGGNNNADSNVTVTGLGGGTFTTSTDANGFANFKSTNDQVTAYKATPNAPSPMPNGDTFHGFDGELFRGQLAELTGSSNTWDGEVTVVVNLSDGTSYSHTFGSASNPFKTNKDIGVLGFDEINDPGVFVTSAFAYAGASATDANMGSWDEFKQIEFSVPGESGVPEPSTWAVMLAGFAFLFAFARRRRLFA